VDDSLVETLVARTEPVKIKSTKDRIIDKDKTKDKSTRGGTIIPDTTKEKAQNGVVIAKGPGRKR
jgi:co-chaperonin GroES (HSP10)